MVGFGKPQFSETFSCVFFMGVFHHQLKVAMPKKKAGPKGFITAVSKRLPKFCSPPKRGKRQVPVKLPKVPVSSSFFGVSVSTDVPQSSVSSRPLQMVGVKVMAVGFVTMLLWVFKEGTTRNKSRNL